MTERTDPMAENAAYNALESLMAGIIPSGGGKTTVARKILGSHAVMWERTVNEAGVPIRRYVMRSEWEVDPERGGVSGVAGDSPLRAGDSVTYTDRRDDGRIWTVQSTGWHYAGIDGQQFVGMTSPSADEVAEHQYVARSMLTLIDRPAR